MLFSLSRKYGSMLMWYRLILWKSKILLGRACRSATPGGTDGVGAAVRVDTRAEESRPILSENTRVMSDWKASACRSHMRFMWLAEVIRHARRGAGQLALLAAAVAGFDDLDAALDLADVLEVRVERCLSARPRPRLSSPMRLLTQSEDARVRAHRLLRSSAVRAGSEQRVERHARIADDRQRLRRRSPADRVRVEAGVAVRASAGLVDVLDAELHRGNRRVLAELLRVDLIQRRPAYTSEPIVCFGWDCVRNTALERK
jgi:hypothetical protein